MKKTLIIFLVLISSISSIQAQEWYTDLDEAKAQALEDNKNIIMVFQGSDWCAPCMKLEKEIWSTDEFKAYAKSHYVMLKADFPRKKANRLSDEQQAKNDALAEEYNKMGFFPLVVVLDKEGKVLGRTGYKNVSPTEYIHILDGFTTSN